MFFLFFLFAVLVLVLVGDCVPLSFNDAVHVVINDNNNIVPEDGYDFPIKEPEEMDITVDHHRNLQFSVSQGTWMSLDVFDGMIVFDLLGDIYILLPNSGGQATRLLQDPKYSVSHDFHPRFSPDGSEVVFVSDIDGCDNLYAFSLVSSNIRQITREKFRFVNAPIVTPDGNSVIAVKWYTSDRSIPAGEIWQFDFHPIDYTNNKGVQLIGRNAKESQSGPEEPYIINNNNFLYFSENTSPGDDAYWQYSKNSHQGIYSIKRLDINTGLISTIVSGSYRGGASKPLVTADGKHLIFIRRYLFDSAMVVLDLETMNERILVKDLTVDQQESSAPYFTYPTYAFDHGNDDGNGSSSLIYYWSKGHIFSVDIFTAEITQIPFLCEVSLLLAETVKAVVNPVRGGEGGGVDHNSFITKIARNPTVFYTDNQGGMKILFTSLARTMLYDSTTNQISAVDENNAYDYFQHTPAFSVNDSARYICHGLWNDVEYGKIVIVDTLGMESERIITTSIGRYADCSFSPNGNSIIFLRLGSDTNTGPFYSANTGVYIVDNWRSQPPSSPRLLASTSVSSAVFNFDGTLLLASRSTSALTINVQMGESQIIANGDYSTEIVISLDRKWIAFVEFTQVYVAPIDSSNGDDVIFASSRPGHQTPNLKRVSDIGGQFLSFGFQVDHSSMLRYVSGSVIHQIDLQFLYDNCFDSTPENEYGLACNINFLTTTDISFTTNNDRPLNSKFAIINATVLTMVSRPNDDDGGDGDENDDIIIYNGAVVVENNIITQVGPEDSIEIPIDAYVINLEGGVLSPSFIDAHAHWSGSNEIFPQNSWEFLVNLAYGVTTMFNPSSNTVGVFTSAELAESGRTRSPRLFSTGTIIYGAGGSSRCEINNNIDAERALRRIQAHGGFSVKSYQQPCRSSRQRLLKAARNLGMTVYPEGGMNFQWNINMLVDGHTTIEHNTPVAPLYEDVLRLFGFSGTTYTPTLVVSFGGSSGERYFYANTNVWEDSKLMSFSPQDSIRGDSLRRMAQNINDYHHIRVSESAKDLYDYGVNVGVGAHGQMQGLAFHWELGLFSQGGFSPLQTMYSGTRGGAVALGMDNYIGQIKVGHLADLIAYPHDSSPLDDIIANSGKMLYTIKNGHIYLSQTMQEIYPNYEEVPPTFPTLNIPLTDQQ